MDWDPHLFDPQFFASLERHAVTLGRRSRAGSVGRHASRSRGESFEFSELRPYEAGDDLRTVDWNAYRRFRRLLVRQYHAEQQRDITILLDASASMAHDAALFNAARRFAGAIAVVAARGNDRVAVARFSSTVAAEVARTRRGGLPREILAYLSDTIAAGPTDIAAALRTVAGVIRRGSATVVVSDFLDEALPEVGITALVQREVDVVCLHVAPESPERLRGALTLRDVESSAELERVLDRRSRGRLARERVAWGEEVRRRLVGRGARYVACHPGEEPAAIVDRVARA